MASFLEHLALALGPILWTGFLWEEGRRTGERGAKEKAWRDAWRILRKDFLPLEPVLSLMETVVATPDAVERERTARAGLWKIIEDRDKE